MTQARAERSLLLRRIVTESVSLRAHEKLRPFMELESAVQKFPANCFDESLGFVQNGKGYENEDQIKARQKKT